MAGDYGKSRGILVREGARRELALQVLFNTLPVASALRFNKIESIDNCIVTGKAEGMISLDESLRVLLRSGKITAETARRYADDPASLA